MTGLETLTVTKEIKALELEPTSFWLVVQYSNNYVDYWSKKAFLNIKTWWCKEPA